MAMPSFTFSSAARTPLDRFVSKMRMYAVREQLLARKPAPHVSNPVHGFA